MIGKAEIYDENMSPIKGFKSLKVQIIRDSNVIGAPIESGQTSFDNKVREPTKVIATGVLVIDRKQEYLKTLLKLKKMFANREFEFYAASDGIDSVENLILKTLPTTRNADRYDWISIELTFVEAMNVQTREGTPYNIDNTDNRNIGYVSGSKTNGNGFAGISR